MALKFCVRAVLILALAASHPGAAGAQPDRSVGRIVFPFAAGGQGDALTRLVAENLRQATGRQYIVENRTGAGGRLGVQAVKAAAPDGSTLLMVPIAPMSVYPHVYDKLGYDPVADFTPISQVATFDFALAVARSVPATSLTELIAWIKANPGKGTYGSPSPGTLPHFFGVEFGRIAGLDLTHVSYRGSAAAITDLVSGHLPVAISSTSDLAEHHRNGTVRILATTDRQRSQVVPGVPTFKEAGFAIEGVSWYALYAPAKTPGDMADRIAAAIAEMLRPAQARERLLTLGLVATATTPAQLRDIQKSDLEYWGPIIARSGYKPEQ
ncbi:MAG: Bug family tripartite tricarboxylate transporter substrate binding protein [Xanthobacteraceae bacterium]|nr:Bug family tripartite tricarboxylate transporter substrate binding protein [Xanthobacteraceae bacterium]